jgi:hypothetical protein
MTLDHAINQLIVTADLASQQIELLQRVLNAPKPERRHAPMQTFKFGPRRSLCELRPRHLVWVEEIGVAESYDRSEMHDYLMEHYDRLFGPLRRPKSKAVASDSLRKSWMISNLLDLAETRRDEYAAERAARSTCSREQVGYKYEGLSR